MRRPGLPARAVSAGRAGTWVRCIAQLAEQVIRAVLRPGADEPAVVSLVCAEAADHGQIIGDRSRGFPGGDYRLSALKTASPRQ